MNIGGIANITILNPETSTSGFDSGPGNILLDHWSQTHLHKAFDEDGSWAREGQLIQTLLDAFLMILTLKKLRLKAQVVITLMKLGSINTYKNLTPFKISKERY